MRRFISASSKTEPHENNWPMFPLLGRPITVTQKQCFYWGRRFWKTGLSTFPWSLSHKTRYKYHHIGMY